MEPISSQHIPKVEKAFKSVYALQSALGNLYNTRYIECINAINDLIHHNIDINIPFKGTTLLHAATAIGDVNLVCKLIEQAGANPLQETDSGLLASHIALRHRLNSTQWNDITQNNTIVGMSYIYGFLKKKEYEQLIFIKKNT
jgi:hypothetical protein